MGQTSLSGTEVKEEAMEATMTRLTTKKPSVSRAPYVSPSDREKMKDSFLSDEERAEKLRKNIVEWKQDIVNEHMLWDMRCWDSYKNRDEILKMIDLILGDGQRIDNYVLNAGHVMWCIEQLVKNGTSKEEICELFMQNNNRQYYAKRIVKCWGGVCGPSPCPHYSEEGGFSKCPCDACDGKV